MPYPSASVVVIHYEEALYQAYAPLPYHSCIYTAALVLTASFQDEPRVSNHSGFCRSRNNDGGGAGDHGYPKTHQRSLFTGRIPFLSPNRQYVSKALQASKHSIRNLSQSQRCSYRHHRQNGRQGDKPIRIQKTKLRTTLPFFVHDLFGNGTPTTSHSSTTSVPQMT